jgi:hypothetical protein
LLTFQTRRLFGAKHPVPTGVTSGIGLPVNLFDAMRCVLGNPDAAAT